MKSSADMVLWMARSGRESTVGMNIKLPAGNDFRVCQWVGNKLLQGDAVRASDSIDSTSTLRFYVQQFRECGQKTSGPHLQLLEIRSF